MLFFKSEKVKKKITYIGIEALSHLRIVLREL